MKEQITLTSKSEIKWEKENIYLKFGGNAKYVVTFSESYYFINKKSADLTVFSIYFYETPWGKNRTLSNL